MKEKSVTILRLIRVLRLLCSLCDLAKCTLYISKPLMIQVKYQCPVLNWNTNRMEPGKKILFDSSGPRVSPSIFSKSLFYHPKAWERQWIREPRFASCFNGQSRLLYTGSLKDWKSVVSLRGHTLQSNLYFPLDASVSFFPCIPVGLSSFTPVKIVY